MRTPFPGMDPYLERPDLWPDVHNGLIAALRRELAPRLRPRYYAAIEERTYLAEPEEGFAGRSDVAVVASTSLRKLRESVAPYTPSSEPLAVTVELPMPDEVTETYLEVRSAETHQVVTVLEILSPTNKRPGEGRTLYERKRLRLLASTANLVEIDLLRGGQPMPLRRSVASHYRILVSDARRRPTATLLPFQVQQAIPAFSLPLLPDDEQPEVALNRILHQLYDEAGYDLRIDYSQDPPPPPFPPEDAAWIEALLHRSALR